MMNTSWCPEQIPSRQNAHGRVPSKHLRARDAATCVYSDMEAPLDLSSRKRRHEEEPIDLRVKKPARDDDEVIFVQEIQGYRNTDNRSQQVEMRKFQQVLDRAHNSSFDNNILYAKDGKKSYMRQTLPTSSRHWSPFNLQHKSNNGVRNICAVRPQLCSKLDPPTIYHTDWSSGQRTNRFIAQKHIPSNFEGKVSHTSRYVNQFQSSGRDIWAHNSQSPRSAPVKQHATGSVTDRVAVLQGSCNTFRSGGVADCNNHEAGHSSYNHPGNFSQYCPKTMESTKQVLESKALTLSAKPCKFLERDMMRSHKLFNESFCPPVQQKPYYPVADMMLDRSNLTTTRDTSSARSLANTEHTSPCTGTLATAGHAPPSLVPRFTTSGHASSCRLRTLISADHPPVCTAACHTSTCARTLASSDRPPPSYVPTLSTACHTSSCVRTLATPGHPLPNHVPKFTTSCQRSTSIRTLTTADHPPSSHVPAFTTSCQTSRSIQTPNMGGHVPTFSPTLLSATQALNCAPPVTSADRIAICLSPTITTTACHSSVSGSVTYASSCLTSSGSVPIVNVNPVLVGSSDEPNLENSKQPELTVRWKDRPETLLHNGQSNDFHVDSYLFNKSGCKVRSKGTFDVPVTPLSFQSALCDKTVEKGAAGETPYLFRRSLGSDNKETISNLTRDFSLQFLKTYGNKDSDLVRKLEAQVQSANQSDHVPVVPTQTNETHAELADSVPVVPVKTNATPVEASKSDSEPAIRLKTDVVPVINFKTEALDVSVKPDGTPVEPPVAAPVVTLKIDEVTIDRAAALPCPSVGVTTELLKPDGVAVVSLKTESVPILLPKSNGIPAAHLKTRGSRSDSDKAAVCSRKQAVSSIFSKTRVTETVESFKESRNLLKSDKLEGTSDKLLDVSCTKSIDLNMKESLSSSQSFVNGIKGNVSLSVGAKRKHRNCVKRKQSLPPNNFESGHFQSKEVNWKKKLARMTETTPLRKQRKGKSRRLPCYQSEPEIALSEDVDFNKKFIDFHPEVLPVRTRMQACSNKKCVRPRLAYNKYAAYEVELEKEEARKQLRKQLKRRQVSCEGLQQTVVKSVHRRHDALRGNPDKQSVASKYTFVSHFMRYGSKTRHLMSQKARAVSRPSRPFSDVRHKARSYESFGESVLHKVVRQGNWEVCLACLQSFDGDVDARNNAGFTALHECCTKGFCDVAEVLLKYGADVNCTSLEGVRPIHDAVDSNHLQLVRLLIEYGADPTVVTYSGQTPVSLATTDEMKLFISGYLGDVNGTLCDDGSSWKFPAPFEKGSCDLLKDVPSDDESCWTDIDFEMESSLKRCMDW